MKKEAVLFLKKKNQKDFYNLGLGCRKIPAREISRQR
jgi:hypothetical protein